MCFQSSYDKGEGSHGWRWMQQWNWILIDWGLLWESRLFGLLNFWLLSVPLTCLFIPLLGYARSWLQWIGSLVAGYGIISGGMWYLLVVALELLFVACGIWFKQGVLAGAFPEKSLSWLLSKEKEGWVITLPRSLARWWERFLFVCFELMCRGGRRRGWMIKERVARSSPVAE